MEIPDVSYAWSGDVAIAYQVLGEGPPDLVLLPFLSNIYTLWTARGFAELGRRLAAVLGAFGRDQQVPRWPSNVEAEILSTSLAGRPLAPIGLPVDKIDDDRLARLEARFG